MSLSFTLYLGVVGHPAWRDSPIGRGQGRIAIAPISGGVVCRSTLASAACVSHDAICLKITHYYKSWYCCGRPYVNSGVPFFILRVSLISNRLTTEEWRRCTLSSYTLKCVARGSVS